MNSLPAPPPAEQDEPRPLGMSASHIRRWLIGFAAAGLLLYLLTPALAGYHLGFNAATDNTCASRVVQWCKFVPGNGPP